MFILRNILTPLQDEFKHSRKGLERGTWFIYTLLAVITHFTCGSRIFMQPSEDRHGEGRERPAIQQRYRVSLLVRDDRPARLDPRIGVFATDGSNRDTMT